MGDEYDQAEADYWENQEEYEFELELCCYVGDAEDSLLGLTPITGGKMRTDQDLRTQAEELRAEAERLERIVAEREKYGEDPFKNGTVLKVDMKYRSGNRSYTYAVIKIGGRFYLSGRMMGQSTLTSVNTPTSAGYTWGNFVAWLAQGDATVWRAKSLEQVL